MDCYRSIADFDAPNIDVTVSIMVSHTSNVAVRVVAGVAIVVSGRDDNPREPEAPAPATTIVSTTIVSTAIVATVVVSVPMVVSVPVVASVPAVVTVMPIAVVAACVIMATTMMLPSLATTARLCIGDE
jgi:hypothetical protein